MQDSRVQNKRRQFDVSRQLLSAVTLKQPALAGWYKRDDGRPLVPCWPLGGLSISHSEQTVALAYSKTGQIGIDVQWQLSRHSVTQLAEMYRCHEADFYRYWTIYEAAFKAGCLVTRPTQLQAYRLMTLAPGWYYWVGEVEPDCTLALVSDKVKLMQQFVELLPSF